MKDALLLANTLCLQNTARNELLKMNVKITERQRNSCTSLLNGDEKENTIASPAYFGCSLDEQLELVQTTVEARQDQEVLPPRCVDVPAAMFKLCEALRQNNRLDTVGLFRIPGVKTRMRLLKANLEKGDDIEDAHTHDIASLLNTFIRRLPDALLPGWTHEAFLRCMKFDEKDKLKGILLLCCLIPSSHLHTLIYLMRFLHEVACHSEQNKMCIRNICAMMTPNIMHSGLIFTCSLAEVGGQLKECYPVVQYLIEIHELIGYLPDEIYDQVCEEMPCTHSCDESMLWSHNSALISMNEGNRSQQRKRGLSGRVGTKLGKLMPKNRQKTPCKKETLERSLHNAKICRKRPSDAHDSHVQAAKRRSLQSPLSVRELAPDLRVAPMIVVSSMSPDTPKFQASPVPNCKFTDEDDVAGKQFGAEGHDRSCTKDHDRPRSAKKLFKFMRVRRRESGNTSCFCVKQQNATVTTIERSHSRFRRSLQRSAKRKSVDIISVPVIPQSSKSMECLDAPSLNYGDGKGEKGSFFKRMSSPQPSPSLNRRRSSGKFETDGLATEREARSSSKYGAIKAMLVKHLKNVFVRGMVSRLASSMSHGRRKSKKSDADLLSPNCLTKQKTKSETGSDHTRSTDTLDSLSSDNTAETLDALDEPVEADQQGSHSCVRPMTQVLAVAERIPDHRPEYVTVPDIPANADSAPEKQTVPSYRNKAFESAAGDSCTSSEEDSLSVHPESIFDLSIDTLIKMNDPAFKRESKSLGTASNRVTDEPKLLTPVRENSTKPDAMKQIGTEDNRKPPADVISPIGNPAAVLSKTYLPSPIQLQAPSPIMPVQHTPSPMRIDSDYGASPSLLGNLQNSKGASIASPAISSPSSVSSSSAGEEIFDDSLGEVYKKFEEVDLSFQEIAASCKKNKDRVADPASNEKQQKLSLPSTGTKSRVARLRTSTRAAVLHSSPAKAPRVGGTGIRKVQSLRTRPVERRQIRASSSMKVDINTPRKNVEHEADIPTANGMQSCEPEVNPKTLMQQTSTSDLITQAAKACVDKRKSSSMQKGFDSPTRNVAPPQKACTPSKQSVATVVRRNRTPHSITRSRVISRRSGGQLPRLRGLHRGPYSPKGKGFKNLSSPARSAAKARALNASPKSGSQFGIQLRSGSLVMKKSEKNPLLGPYAKKSTKAVAKSRSGDVTTEANMHNTVDTGVTAGFSASHFPTVSLGPKDNQPKPVIQSSTLSKSHSMRQKGEATGQKAPARSERDAGRGAEETRNHRKSLSAPGGKWSSDSSLYLRSGLFRSEDAPGEMERKERGRSGYVSEFINRFNELAQRNAQIREGTVSQRKASSFRATTVGPKATIGERKGIQPDLSLQNEDNMDKPTIPENHSISEQNTEHRNEGEVDTTAADDVSSTFTSKTSPTAAHNGNETDPEEISMDVSYSAGIESDSAKPKAALMQTPKIKQPLMKLPKSGSTKPKKHVESMLCTSFDMLSDYSIIEAEETPRKGTDTKGSLVVTITTPVIKESKDKKKSAKRNRVATPGKAQKRENLEASLVGSNSNRRSPLIIRNLNTQQDFLDNSPVRRATPTKPRSREPMKPMVPYLHPSDSPAKSKIKTNTPNKLHGGVESSKSKTSKGVRSNKGKGTVTSKRGPGSKKLCKSLEALDSPKSLVGKKSKQYYSVSAKDLSATISNPMTVVDSRSVKHTAL